MRLRKHTNRRRLGQNSGRRSLGTAAVELAICMPILVILALATIEACAMMHVQQSLKISEFEGARVGTVPGASATNVTYQCQTLLDDHSVESYKISMDPPDPSSAPAGWDFGDPVPPNARWLDLIAAVQVFNNELTASPQEELLSSVL